MTVELEEFTEWRHSVEDRLCKLEAASDRRAVQISDHGGTWSRWTKTSA